MRSCLKPKNPCSNHEILLLFEHGFYLTKPIWALVSLYDVKRESFAALTDHFTDVCVRKNVECVYNIVANDI